MECASNEPTDTRRVVGIQISAQLRGKCRENLKGLPFHSLSFPTPFLGVTVRSWRTSSQLPFHAFTQMHERVCWLFVTTNGITPCVFYFSFLTFPFHTAMRALRLPHPCTRHYFLLPHVPVLQEAPKARDNPTGGTWDCCKFSPSQTCCNEYPYTGFSPSHMQIFLTSSFFFNIYRPGAEILGSFQNLKLTNCPSGGSTIITIPASSVKKPPFLCTLTNV